jgi:hypothetical protein
MPQTESVDLRGKISFSIKSGKIFRGKILDNVYAGYYNDPIIFRAGIKSPTGKDTWPKRSIDVILSNEKYIGNARLLDDGKHSSYYLAEDNNPAIISKETFQAVQIEKQHRSNVIKKRRRSPEKKQKIQLKKVKNKNSLIENHFLSA